MENSTAVPPMPVSYASALKRNSPGPAAAPATPPSSPSLSPPPSSIISSPLPPTLPTPPPSPETPPSSPDDSITAKEPHWAFPGRLAWLGTGRIGPSSVIHKRLRSQELIDGFENHPVLIWSAPNEDGIAKIIPITSYGGKRVEVKWSKMRDGQLKWVKLQQLLMFEHGKERPHRGTERLLFTKPISCRKRSYLHIEHGIFKIEVDCLEPYTVGFDTAPTITGSSMSYIFSQLFRFVDPRLWIGVQELVELQQTTDSEFDSEDDLTAPWRKL
ncbi:hypothetical protein BFW01_g8034 [Lasiodiplodia theobromae]|uniref:Uncharacterized protein n=1 Tax=Lasiodiplodia theobromae TaxID=45133 RepID=A0A5N5DCG8_9PEZI|nr:hypothetical protein DBV05_g6470 [Lasiodiplodia theobromae]KAF9637138.1 hypothetical protein BFW01_g8034 [Lasiodiplodia theobromae]